MKQTLPKESPPATPTARRKAARQKADGFMGKNRKFCATLRSGQGAWMVILVDYSNALPSMTIGEARQLHNVLGRVLQAYDGRHDR